MNIVGALTLVLTLSILVQFVVDRIKTFVPISAIGKVELAPIYALIVGISVAFVAKVDLLVILEVAEVSTIGYILTGIVLSGGSAAVHELIAKLRESRMAITVATTEKITEKTNESGTVSTTTATESTTGIIAEDKESPT